MLKHSTRLTYRRPVRDDLTDLHAMDNDPEVMRWINGGLPVSLDQFTELLLPVYLNEMDAPGLGFWVIEAGGVFAGWISLRPVDEPGKASIGYRLKRSAWGVGYATEAVLATLDYAFGDRCLAAVTATTYEGNLGSRRVLEKSGMRLVRRFRINEEALLKADTSIEQGEVWDLSDLVFEMTAAEFR